MNKYLDQNKERISLNRYMVECKFPLATPAALRSKV